MISAVVISIGNELTSGHVTNSNSVVIAKYLKNRGIPVRLIITVGDYEDQIINVLHNLPKEIRLVFITGGLGPTNDDITVQALAKYCGKSLIYKKEIIDRIEERFRRRGFIMSEENRKQAYIPENAQILSNPVGSAPGLKFEQDGRVFFVMPGVPVEMEAMLTTVIAPELEKFSSSRILQKIIHVTGLPESQVYAVLKLWIEQHPAIEVAFLPLTTHTDVVLTIRESADEKVIATYVRQVTALLADHVFGYDDDTLENCVARMLVEKHLTIAVAESCTGGLIAHRLTNVAGSSDYFKMGVVVYSNEAKIRILGIDCKIIEKHGAVSPEVAGLMAQQVRRISGCNLGISSTGIAGPSGGSDSKPVGLVWIGISDQNNDQTLSFNFTRDRLTNKLLFSQAALNQLRLLLTAL